MLGVTAVASVVRHRHKKKVPDDEHIYDVPNLYERTPLPPPQPTTAVYESISTQECIPVQENDAYGL